MAQDEAVKRFAGDVPPDPASACLLASELPIPDADALPPDPAASAPIVPRPVEEAVEFAKQGDEPPLSRMLEDLASDEPPKLYARDDKDQDTYIGQVAA